MKYLLLFISFNLFAVNNYLICPDDICNYNKVYVNKCNGACYKLDGICKEQPYLCLVKSSQIDNYNKPIFEYETDNKQWTFDSEAEAIKMISQDCHKENNDWVCDKRCRMISDNEFKCDPLCKDGFSSYHKYIDLKWRVYCAKIIGYEKDTVKKLLPDQTKINEWNTQQEQKEQEKTEKLNKKNKAITDYNKLTPEQKDKLIELMLKHLLEKEDIDIRSINGL